MLRNSHLSVLCGFLLAVAAAAQDVGESPLGEAVERHLPGDEAVTQWTYDPQLLQTEASDRLETRQVTAEQVDTVKIQNVIPPIRFESGVSDIPPSYVESLRETLDGLQDRRNVRLHLVGHADNQPLSDALARVYGNNAGLSRERAGEVAEFLQTRLGLPPEAISYEWAGDSKPIAPNATATGRALNRRVEVEVWYDVAKERPAEQEVLVKDDFKRVKICRVQTVCKMRFREGNSRRARVRNLVPPLHFNDEATDVSAAFIEQIRKTFRNLGDKQNVMVRFIGYTDDLPLTGRNERIYGDQVALSRAQAHRVELAVQEALHLSSTALSSDGRGASMPLAANDTEQGRAMNRRVEVEFWHDDPLQELPDEPQLCPDGADAEVVTKVYDPPWGRIASLQLENGRAVIPPGYTDDLRRAMTDISERNNVRLRFVGYTKNERLDRRTAMVYGDDIGLSAARARRAMETIRDQMQLSATQAEHEGRGYVQSSDIVNVGFTQGDTSYVAVQVVYDELAVPDNYEGVDITRINRELSPKNPFGLNLMRITVDGEPIDDTGRSSADIQRCTDMALDRADIQFQFDNLQSKRRLSVAASPTTVVMRKADVAEQAREEVPDEPGEEQPADLTGDDQSAPAEQVASEAQLSEAEQSVQQEPPAEQEQLAGADQMATVEQLPETEQPVADDQAGEPEQPAETEQSADDEQLSPEAEPAGEGQPDQPEPIEQSPPPFSGSPVRFRTYVNYSSFIDHAEVRIFEADQSLQAVPLDVVAIDARRVRRMAADGAARSGADARAEICSARLRQERQFRRNESAAAVDGVPGRLRNRGGAGTGGDTAAGRRAARELRRERPLGQQHSARQRHGQGSRQRHSGAAHRVGRGSAGTAGRPGQFRRRRSPARGHAHGRGGGAGRGGQWIAISA